MNKLIKDKNVQLFFSALGVRLIVLLLISIFAPLPFSELANWYDGDSYIQISQSFPLPYEYPSMLKKVKFYPLFPFLIYLTSMVVKNSVVSAYLIVVLASSLSVVVFYNIAKKYTENAFELSLLFCCFPPKWLAVSTFVWSEPVFMLCLLSAFLLFLEDKPLAAFTALGLAGVARPIGILFWGSFILYVLLCQREKIVPTLKYSVVAIIPFVVFHSYLFFKFGDVLLYAGSKILSYPLQGLIDGLFDTNLLTVRKIYTSSVFVLYVIAFFVAMTRIKQPRYSLLSMWFLPYFIFTCFLKGEPINWWIICFPRYALPIAPAGMILIGSYFPKKMLRYITAAALLLGIAYSVGVCFLRISNATV